MNLGSKGISLVPYKPPRTGGMDNDNSLGGAVQSHSTRRKFLLSWLEETITYLKLSIILAFETPKSRIIALSSMLTTAENIAAKTIV